MLESPINRTRAALALAIAIAGFALPAQAAAKVSCEQSAELSEVELAGLPASPEAERTYEVGVELPRDHAVNPNAVLMALRCQRPDRGPAAIAGSDSVSFEGVPAPKAGVTFAVRFPKPGPWHVATMDVSGSFRDHGYFDVVVPAGAPPVDEGERSSAIPIVAAAGALSGALALALWRRLRRDA